MKTKNSYLLSLIVFVICSIVSCKKFIDGAIPSTVITGPAVFANNSSAAAAVTSIYISMMSTVKLSSGVNSISFLEGLAADELTNYSSSITPLQFYKNALIKDNTYYWQELYNEIYVTNKIVENINNSSAITSPLKEQLLGETKFMRALLYFYTMNLYGDIPFTLTTDYKENSTLSRTSTDVVSQQIIQDLKDAKSLLSDQYYNSYGEVANTRVRPNRSAAAALLARVYLYSGKWKEAEEQASVLIGNTNSYELVTDLNKAFLIESKEAIWQLQTVITSNITFDAEVFILKSPPGSGANPAAISQSLLAAFEPGDERLKSWVGVYTKDSLTYYYYPFKYKVSQRNSTIPSTEYLIVLRLAEQYLIRAEARARQGNIDDARKDLNSVRTKAKLPDVLTNDKDILLAAILHERQTELFTEWGHRWFDLKRTNQLNTVMSTESIKKGSSWDPNWALLPIPQSEILLNKNLTPNPGY
jgi:starch-binding outer membrane protein, SusD/RagB family